MHGTGSQSLLTSPDIEYKIIETGLEWFKVDETILTGNNSLYKLSKRIFRHCFKNYFFRFAWTSTQI